MTEDEHRDDEHRDGVRRPPPRRRPRRATGGTPAPSGADDRPVLPSRSEDDTDQGWGGPAEPPDDDERYLREVPPHW